MAASAGQCLGAGLETGNLVAQAVAFHAQPVDQILHGTPGGPCIDEDLVEIRGPMTKEQKADLEKAREFIQEGKELIALIEAKLKRKPRDKSLKSSLQHVRRTHQRIFNAVPEWVAAYINS